MSAKKISIKIVLATGLILASIFFVDALLIDKIPNGQSPVSTSVLTLAPVTQLNTDSTASSQIPEENPLILEKVIEIEDGFVLIGYFEFGNAANGPRLIKTSQHPGYWRVIDGSGQMLPFIDVSAKRDRVPDQHGIDDNYFSWAIELSGKQFNWPLTIKFDSVAGIYPDLKAEFDFDAGPSPYPGQTWDLGFDLQLGDYAVRVISAQYTGDGYIFVIQSTSGVWQVEMEINGFPITGGVHAGWNPDSNQMDVQVQFLGQVPMGKLDITLTQPTVQIAGAWQTHWRSAEDMLSTIPPIDNPTSRICLTKDTWLAALDNPGYPEEISGELFVREVERISESENRSTAYLVELPVGRKQLIGKVGEWWSVSPDGTQIVYSDFDGLYWMSITSGKSYHIPNTEKSDHNPFWSKDGEFILFGRATDQELYRITLNGSNLQKVFAGPEYERMLGWYPAGTELLYAVGDGDDASYRKLDLSTGISSEVLAGQLHQSMYASVSPDGESIVFSDRITQSLFGVYVANPDGTEKRQIANMDYHENFWITGPVWSPDAKWLILMVDLTVKDLDDKSGVALLNLRDCELTALPFTDTVGIWLP